MVTEWLVRRFVGPGDPEKDLAHRARYGLLEGWLGVVLNAALFLVKGVLGVMSGSIALLADAVHTLADMATSGVVILGFRISVKPSDEEHPFGHGRAETIATLVVAVLLVVAGVEFARSSVERLVHPVQLDVTWLMVVILFITLVIKEWMARFSGDLGRRIGSEALQADAWHHRTDSLATAIVIAGFLLSRLGLAWVDGVAGLGVSAIILWTGFDIGRRAVSRLLGQAPTEEEVEEITRKALEIDGVEGVHEVIVHKYGNQEVISLHIEVTADRSPLELHHVSELVERHLSRGQNGMVVVHVDPIDKNHPHYDEIHEILADAVAEDPRCHSFHDLRIVGLADDFHVLFDLAVHLPFDPKGEGVIKKAIVARIRERFPNAQATIKVEPAFVRSS